MTVIHGVKLVTTKDKVEINGKEYPPTIHNLHVWRKFKETGNKKELERLSTVVLDI